MWKIETEQELKNLVEQLKNNAIIDINKLDLSFLNQLTIKVKGNVSRYNGSLNFAICKGICEYQTEIWKAYAEIKTGVPDLRKLTQSEKEALEIQFEINEGCTEIIAKLTEFCNSAKGLVKEVANGMTGNQKMLTIIALAICAGVYFGAEKYIDNQTDIALANINAEKEKAIAENETVRLNEILTTIRDVANNNTHPRVKQSIQAIEEHTHKGFSEIVRAVNDADSVTITQANNTKITLSNEQLNKIVEDADLQEKAATKPEIIDVYIDGVKRSNSKVTIHIRTTQNEEFSANVDTDMLGEDGVNQIIDRIKDYNTIRLSGMVKRRGENIERATITEIITPE